MSKTVGELLSSPTISSSRFLSTYSIALLAILWTGTELRVIPGLGEIGESEATRASVALLVCIFATVSHAINWKNDTTAKLALNQNTEYKKLRGFDKSRRMSSPEIYLEHLNKIDKKTQDKAKSGELPPSFKSPVVAAVYASSYGKQSSTLNWIVKNGMHLIVPLCLATLAVVSLLFIIVD